MISRDYKIKLSSKNKQFLDTLFELKSNDIKFNGFEKEIDSNTIFLNEGISLWTGLKMSFSLPAILGKGLISLGGKKSGLILISPKSKLTDSFQDEVKDYVFMVVKSVVISAILNIAAYTLFMSFHGISNWDIASVGNIILQLGVLISLEALVYKIIKKVLIKFNDGKPLPHEQSIILLTIVVGIVGYIIKTRLLDYEMEVALVSSIISAVCTYTLNKLLSREYKSIKKV